MVGLLSVGIKGVSGAESRGGSGVGGLSGSSWSSESSESSESARTPRCNSALLLVEVLKLAAVTGANALVAINATRINQLSITFLFIGPSFKRCMVSRGIYLLRK